MPLHMGSRHCPRATAPTGEHYARSRSPLHTTWSLAGVVAVAHGHLAPRQSHLRAPLVVSGRRYNRSPLLKTAPSATCERRRAAIEDIRRFKGKRFPRNEKTEFHLLDGDFNHTSIRNGERERQKRKLLVEEGTVAATHILSREKNRRGNERDLTEWGFLRTSFSARTRGIRRRMRRRWRAVPPNPVSSPTSPPSPIPLSAVAPG
ncbi:hypothetical protein B296_00058697 [Ensete ventricosum]|uniref:Uncharacterized protein n=1 Tax=Ensete ventricosum TaxID=4639 RepID=A0A426XKY2_ENSVE|nr:hypothetical protein B296_00058697 [Ensete ventricosum]